MSRCNSQPCVEQLIGSGLRNKYDSPVCLLSSCLFNLYAEHIMRNARLDELQAEIKIGWRNISNLRFTDDTTLMAETKRNYKAPLDEGEGRQ